MKIESNVLDVLGNATMTGNSLQIDAQLDRKLYVAVNQVLELAGGQWNRKAKAHLFPSDAAELMDQIILTGEIANKPQELGYFPTPPAVVARLLESANIKSDMLVLEPSAGRGAILFELLKLAPCVDCYEIDHANADFLVFSKGPHSVKEADFLTVTPEPIYDRVVMNPPFAKNAAPKHVLHAFKFLAPGGRLIAIMPSSVCFRTDKLNEQVRSLARSIEPLPNGSFASSGTNVNTVIVTIHL